MTGEEKQPITRVLPIVGLDVGAISCSSLVSFGLGGTFAILLFVFIFIKSFSIELWLPGGGFSISPPSAILNVSGKQSNKFNILDKSNFSSKIM